MPVRAFRLALTVAAFGAGCGGSKAPAETAAPPAAASETGGATDEPVTGEASSSSPASSSAPSPPGPPPAGVLCEKMCDAQAAKCTPEQLKNCKHNYCSRYAGAPEACDPAARAALECAQKQPDFLLCSNVVPESCGKRFFAVEKCLATGVAPPPDAEGPKTPDGWARYEAADAGFSVLMPKGVETKTEAGLRTWSSKSGDATYVITLGPPPAEKKFDGKAFLKIATKLLGPCAPKMKLFAIVEKPDRTLIQFKTVCPDKTQERGVLYVHGPDYFVVRSRWGEAPNPDADTFAYSFERKK